MCLGDAIVLYYVAFVFSDFPRANACAIVLVGSADVIGDVDSSVVSPDGSAGETGIWGSVKHVAGGGRVLRDDGLFEVGCADSVELGFRLRDDLVEGSAEALSLLSERVTGVEDSMARVEHEGDG